MTALPDATWIREAEMYGMPSPDPVYCPICGEECETIYKDKDREVFGCDRCIQTEDAGDWYEAEKEASLPDWIDEGRDR